MIRIALVGCAASKLDQAAPARALYTSTLFRKSLDHALANFDRGHVFILSAKHHVLALDKVVEPYDLSLHDFKPHELAEWGHAVCVDLKLLFPLARALELHVFAGLSYATPIRWQLSEFPGWAVEEPMFGLTVGQRLRWLNLQGRAA